MGGETGWEWRICNLFPIRPTRTCYYPVSTVHTDVICTSTAQPEVAERCIVVKGVACGFLSVGTGLLAGGVNRHILVLTVLVFSRRCNNVTVVVASSLHVLGPPVAQEPPVRVLEAHRIIVADQVLEEV